MKLLKTTAIVVLLVQTFRLASLQDSTDSPDTMDKSWLRDSTDSPGRPIDRGWWRDRPKNEIPKPDADADQGNDGDYSGIASGSMATNSEEERNIAGETNETESDATTASPHVFQNDTKTHKHHKTTVAPTLTNATNSNNSVDAMEANSTDSSGSPDVPSATAENSTMELANGTGSVNETTTTTNSSTGEFPPKMSDQNSTAASNATGNGTTNAIPYVPEDATTAIPNVPEDATTKNSNVPEDATTKNTNVPEDATTKNPNVPEDATTKNPNKPKDTTTKNPNVPEDATTKNSNVPEDTTSAGNMPENSSSAAPVPPEKSNNTDKSGGGSGSGSERGVASDPSRSTRKGVWSGVLSTAVAVGLLGLVAYIVLKKKHHKAFSHRKLVEDFPSDPVHRLDNNEPLDLNFGGSAYYNPGLQGDNIQMSNIHGRP